MIINFMQNKGYFELIIIKKKSKKANFRQIK